MNSAWGPIVSLVLWGTALVSVQQSRTCPCPQVDVKIQQFVEQFCYFAIAWTVLSLAGTLFKSLTLPGWLTGGIVSLYIIGQLVWAIATLYYMEQLKVCACKESYADSVTYWFAVSEVVSVLLVAVALGTIGGGLMDSTSMISKAFTKGFRKGFRKSLK